MRNQTGYTYLLFSLLDHPFHLLYGLVSAGQLLEQLTVILGLRARLSTGGGGLAGAGNGRAEGALEVLDDPLLVLELPLHDLVLSFKVLQLLQLLLLHELQLCCVFLVKGFGVRETGMEFYGCRRGGGVCLGLVVRG
jgi:hypothetical protein